MSDLVEKKLKDIDVIARIKQLIKLTLEKSKDNFEISTTDISNVHVNHTHNDDGNVISLVVKNLNNLELDDYNLNILNKDIQEQISNLVNLNQLCLVRNGINHLIPDLKNLVNLEILDLSDNKLAHLPKDVLTSKNLKRINFSKNEFSELQGFSNPLNFLEQIDLSHNNFTAIPNVNIFARNLKVLNSSSNPIQSVGKYIKSMENIEEIYLGKSLIKDVENHTFYNTVRLRILDLSNNNLRDVNFDYSRLNKLERLCLYGNPISDFRNISNFIQKIIKNRDFKGIEVIEKLVIAYFEILTKENEFIYEIEGSNVTKLKIPFQEISQLPESIGSLVKLRELDLKGNKLKSLPRSFEKLVNLEKLELAANYSIKLPDDFLIYSKLTELNISWCNLLSIPDSLIELKNLKKLNISSNRITKIHPKIGDLVKLEELDLSYNNLDEIQAPIAELIRLKHLKLAGNNIRKIPEAISELKNLEILNLNFNQIQDLVSGLSFLNNLKVLYLIHNRIEEIPDYIFNLKSLKVGHFTANKIVTISGEVNALEKFKEFYISENPLPLHLRYKYFLENYTKKVTLKELYLNNVYSFKESEFLDLSQLSLLVGTNNSGKSNFFKIIENLKPFASINQNVIFTNSNHKNVLLHYLFELSDEMINYIIECIKNYSEISRFIDFNNLIIKNNELTVSFYEFLKNTHIKLKLDRGGSQYQIYVSSFGFISEGKTINLIQYPDVGDFQSKIYMLNSNWKKITINHLTSIMDFTWSSNSNPRNLSYNELRQSKLKWKDISNFDFALFLYNEILEYFDLSQKIIEHRNFEPEIPLALKHDSIIHESGNNFPDILELFLHEDLKLQSILRELLSEFYPEIVEIWSESVSASDGIMSRPFITELTEKRYFENLGKGLHQILIILTHLLQLEENYTLLIEEPELFIHPQLQKILYRIIQRFLPFHQIFITTHSPFILNSHDEKSSIHQIIKVNDASLVKNIKKDELVDVIQELGVRPSDILMNNGFLLVEGERDIRLFKKIFKEVIKKHHLELIPFKGKDKLHYYADHDIISKLINRGFKFRIILDNDEGNQKNLEDIKDPNVKEHILLLPVREVENLYINPELFKTYLNLSHKKVFEGENIKDFIEEMLSEAITTEMLWDCKVKTLIDRIKFRFSREEIEEMLRLTSEDELLDGLDALLKEKYQIIGIDKEYYSAKFKEIESQIDAEKHKWKIVEGKRLRKKLSQVIKSKKGITLNFEKIENLMKEDFFTRKNLIFPIESYFNSVSRNETLSIMHKKTEKIQHKIE